jgi:hypothetical protein
MSDGPAMRFAGKQAHSPNIADSEVLNEASQIALKIDFVCVIESFLGKLT